MDSRHTCLNSLFQPSPTSPGLFSKMSNNFLFSSLKSVWIRFLPQTTKSVLTNTSKRFSQTGRLETVAGLKEQDHIIKKQHWKLYYQGGGGKQRWDRREWPRAPVPPTVCGWRLAGAVVAGESASQLSKRRKQKVHSACPSVSRRRCLQTALPKSQKADSEGSQAWGWWLAPVLLVKFKEAAAYYCCLSWLVGGFPAPTSYAVYIVNMTCII